MLVITNYILYGNLLLLLLLHIYMMEIKVKNKYRKK
jgi:hypothetical protein